MQPRVLQCLGLQEPCRGWAGRSLFGLGRGRTRGAKETFWGARILLPGSSLVPEENTQAGSARSGESFVTPNVCKCCWGELQCTNCFFFFIFYY